MTKLQTMPLRFRVWDKCSEQFYQIKDAYPELPGLTDEFKNCSELDLMDLSSLDRSLGGIFKDDNFVISQDTGMKDKNGKSVFASDIVDIQGVKYYVDFAYGGFWFNNDRRKWKAYRAFTHLHEWSDTEIIGNLFQNPELLEE